MPDDIAARHVPTQVQVQIQSTQQIAQAIGQAYFPSPPVIKETDLAASGGGGGGDGGVGGGITVESIAEQIAAAIAAALNDASEAVGSIYQAIQDAINAVVLEPLGNLAATIQEWWEDTSAALRVWLRGLYDNTRAAIDGLIGWWDGRAAAWVRGESTLDSINRVLFGEKYEDDVDPARLRGMKVTDPPDPDLAPTTDTTDARTIWEWMAEDVAGFFGLIGDNISMFGQQIIAWLDADEGVMGWIYDNVTNGLQTIVTWWAALGEAWTRGSSSYDSILRVVLGEKYISEPPVPNGLWGKEVTPDRDIVYPAEMNNTVARGVIDVVFDNGIMKWLFDTFDGFGVDLRGTIAGAIGALSEWWNGLEDIWKESVERYGRGSDTLDGIARFMFGERRRSDDSETLPDPPTTENTRAATIGEWLGHHAENFWTWITGQTTELAEALTDAIDAWWMELIGVADTAINWLINLDENIRNNVNDAVEWYNHHVSRVLEDVQEITEDAWEAMGGFVRASKKWWEDVSTGAINWVKNLTTTTYGALTKLYDWLGSGEVAATIQGFVTGLGKAVWDAATGFQASARKWWDDIASGANNVIGWLKGLIGTVRTSISSLAAWLNGRDVVTAIQAAATDTAQSIGTVLSQVASDGATWIQNTVFGGLTPNAYAEGSAHTWTANNTWGGINTFTSGLIASGKVSIEGGMSLAGSGVNSFFINHGTDGEDHERYIGADSQGNLKISAGEGLRHSDEGDPNITQLRFGPYNVEAAAGRIKIENHPAETESQEPPAVGEIKYTGRSTVVSTSDKVLVGLPDGSYRDFANIPTEGGTTPPPQGPTTVPDAPTITLPLRTSTTVQHSRESYTVEGTAAEGTADIRYRVGSGTVNTATLGSGRSFSFTITLAVGANSVQIWGRNARGAGSTLTYTITRQQAPVTVNPPTTLTLTSHTSGETVDNPDVTLIGQTDRDASVGILWRNNGQSYPAKAANSGGTEWRYGFTLVQGLNTFVVSAARDGQTLVETYTLTYMPAVVIPPYDTIPRITSPAGGDSIMTSTITVTGTSGANTTSGTLSVRIGGVTTTHALSFTNNAKTAWEVEDVMLSSEGEYVLSVSATDGTTARVSPNVRITYSAPEEEIPVTGDQVRLRIGAAVDRPDRSSAADLDSTFGKGRGSFGVLPDTTRSGRADEIVVWVRTSNAWFGFEWNRTVDNTRNLVGTALQGASGNRRIRYSSSSVYRPTDQVDEGRFFLHEDIDTTRDGSWGVFKGTTSNTSQRIGYRLSINSNRQYNADSVLGTVGSRIGDLPIINLGNSEAPNSAALDSAFGTAEGSFGFNKGQNRIYIKVDGRWYYNTTLILR